MKKLFFLAGITSIILAHSCFAQDFKVTKGFVKSYSGNIINEKADINLLIIRDSVVKGTYSLQSNSIPVNVSGKMKHKKDIYLKELSEQTERNGEFIGQLTDSMFQGKYTDKKNKKKGKFSFKEFAPKSAMEFNVFSLSGAKKLYSLEHSPKCEFHFSFLFPKIFTNQDVLDSVQKIIKQTYFYNADNAETGINFTENNINPEKLLLNQAELLSKEYLKTYPDSIDPNFFYGPQDWDYYFDMAVVENQNNLLSLVFSVYEYTGGAHGNYGNVYKNIDLRTGKSIWLKDLFIEGYEDYLNKKITEHIKLNYKIDENTSLINFGFWEDTIAANDNFYLTSGGIGFYFNPYEIAPYSMGTTDVFIPFTEISGILKKGNLFFLLN